MKILLAGASGFIGRHLEHALEAANHKIAPADRRHGIDYNHMLEVDDWLPHVRDIDVVINCVGIIAELSGQTFTNLHQLAPVALFRACAQVGIERVVQISALGADEQAFTPYQLSKKAADDVLRALPIDWFVLRPSLVYGDEGSSMKMFQRLARLPLLPLANAGKQLIQPVHISDLVATVLQCLETETPKQTLNVVGPYALTFAEWLQILREKQGRGSVSILPIPFGMVMAAAQVGHFFIPILHPDNLRMLQKGNTADVQPLVEFLGRPPLSVEEVL